MRKKGFEEIVWYKQRRDHEKMCIITLIVFFELVRTHDKKMLGQAVSALVFPLRERGYLGTRPSCLKLARGIVHDLSI